MTGASPGIFCKTEFALDRFNKRTLGTLLDAVAANYVDRETFAFDEQRRSYSTLKTTPLTSPKAWWS
jgi:hypothetical protein